MTTLYAYPGTRRSYFKYTYSEFIQPAPMEGLGGAVFGVNATPSAWWPNGGSINQYCDECCSWIDRYMYNPRLLKPTKFQLYVSGGWSSASSAYENRFYGSLDGSSYTELGYTSGIGKGGWGYIDMSSNTNYYKYFRFVCRNGCGAYNDNIVISNLRIYGEERVTGEATAEEIEAGDYDYFVDTPTRQIFNIKQRRQNKYYLSKQGYSN